MGFSDLLKRPKDSHSQPENEAIITSDNDKSTHSLSKDEKMDEIIALLKALTMVISQHDHHLTLVNNSLSNRINELAARKKGVSEAKKIEVENILRKHKNRVEAIEKLKAIGISQASAYRYTESLKEVESEEAS
jgi:hypothetical protein